MVFWRRQQHIGGVLFVLMLLWEAVFSQSANVQLETRIIPQPVYEQQPVQFEIRITWKGQPQDWQLVALPKFKLNNFILEKSGSATRTQIQANGDTIAQRIFTFDLKPISAGEGVITGGTITLKNRQGQVINLAIPETPITILASGGQQPRFLAYIYLILLLVLALAVVYSFVLYFRRRHHTPQTEAALTEVFRNRLASEVDPKGGNLRQSFERLERIYRDFLAANSANGENNFETSPISNNLHQYLEDSFTRVREGQLPLSDQLFLEVYQSLLKFIEQNNVPAQEEPLVK